MNFRMVSFQKAACIRLALALLFLTTPIVIADEAGKSLSPFALKVFEYCMDAAIESRQLTEHQLVTELRPTLEEFSGSARGSLTFEIEDDFECVVQIPTESYDPKTLRGLLVTLQVSSFDGRVNGCYWVSGVQGGRASVLQCSLHSKSDPANIFQVNTGIFPVQGAIFWIKPVLIFDEDGYVRLGD